MKASQFQSSGVPSWERDCQEVFAVVTRRRHGAENVVDAARRMLFAGAMREAGSQKELAVIMGLSERAVSYYLHGDRTGDRAAIILSEEAPCHWRGRLASSYYGDTI